VVKEDSDPFVYFSWILKIPYKIIEKSNKCKLNFAVLRVTRATTFSKYVYTFEL
jgi:hypothetical protein